MKRYYLSQKNIFSLKINLDPKAQSDLLKQFLCFKKGKDQEIKRKET